MNITTDPGLVRLGWVSHAAGLGVTIALIGLTNLLLLNSLRRQEAQLDDQLAAASDYLDHSDEIYARADRLEAQLADDESRLAAVSALIPSHPRESDFLEQITRLARSAGVRVSEYHPSDAVSDGSHSAMEIRLQTSATYESICRFLDGLESLPRLCRVTQLSINSPKNGTYVHNVSLTLRIYYATFDPFSQEST